MNCYAKMRRSNAKARAALSIQGYRNIHLFPHTRFIKDVEIEGLKFDGLCTREHLAVFQVKSNCKPSKALQAAMQEQAERLGIQCLWINVKDRKPCEIYGETK